MPVSKSRKSINKINKDLSEEKRRAPVSSSSSTSSFFSSLSSQSDSLSNSVLTVGSKAMTTTPEKKEDQGSSVNPSDVVKQHTELCMATLEGVGANEFQDNAIPRMDDLIPHELQDICLEYGRESSEKNVSYPRILFFDKHLARIVTDAADHILWGRLDEAEALVQQYSSILKYSIETKDPCGRRVAGTLLQIAAMAGDFNLKKNAAENDDGMVERLTKAGGVSKEEVAKQLHAVLFSEEAKKENEQRNKRILAALIEFAENIIQTDLIGNNFEEFKEAQAKYQLYINKFREALMPDPNEVITSGFIFDSQILFEAAKWFEDKKNLDRFGGWRKLKSDLFWINGFGSLQNVVSARDAHVIREGIGNVVDEGRLPGRSLKNTDGSSYFYNSSARKRLGVDFYLGYFGGPGRRGGPAVFAIEKLMSSKNRSMTKFMQHLNNPSKKNGGLIM